MQVATTTSHGLLAIKWVLAGDEAGFPLVASLSLVAINTELLVRVAAVVHMRSILAHLATSRDYRIDFGDIGSLMGTPFGLVCIAWNVTVALVLLVCTLERVSELWRLLPWVATAVGSLVWANTTFKGIGASTWKDMEVVATTSTPVATVSEFLALLNEEDARSVVEDLAEERSNWWSRLVATLGTARRLSLEDRLLERHWMAVLFAAFPEHPKMRVLHTMSFAFFKMLPFVMPALLVVYSLSRMPQIAALEVLGCVVSPAFVPASSEYFLSLEPGWNAELSLKFEMEVGSLLRVALSKLASLSVCCLEHHGGLVSILMSPA